MKSSQFLLVLAAITRGITAAAISDVTDVALDTRSSDAQSESQYSERREESEELWKRKGGGGGGGRGGSGGSSGGSSGSSGGRGGSGSSGSSGGSSGGRGSSSSNGGGSGVRPAYGGGAFYGGGAKQPYKAGTRSPSGILPYVVGGAALGYIGFLGVHWLYGAYVYPYTHQYYYHNATTNQNETKPVVCLCDYYGVCGCDDNQNQTYFNSIIGDGTYANLDKSLVTVAENETTHQQTIYILGTLPNDTTASGNTEGSNAASGLQGLARAVGWWPVITTAIAIAFL